MTRYGVSLKPATNDTHSADHILGYLDFWADEAGTYPDLFPIWHPTPRSTGDEGRLRDGLRERGVEAVLYLTSDKTGAAVTALATAWAKESDPGDAIVRFNQEPNGDWKAPWAQLTPEEYIDQFRRASDAIRKEAPNARMFYCPILKRKVDLPEFREYYPGDDHVDIVGFDAYSRTSKPVATRWSRPVRGFRLFAQGKPVVIGETGILRDVSKKRAWIRRLDDVWGVQSIIYFDIDMDSEKWKGHRWRMTSDMRRVYGRLI